MNIIITGGGGFIGSQLARALLRRKSVTFSPASRPCPITRVTLIDVKIPDQVRGGLAGDEIEVVFVESDITAPDFFSTNLPTGENPFAVFHLASIVSGQGEVDFDLAMRVNLDSTRQLLEHCRKQPGQPRAVFASSVATFGGHAMTPTVSDRTKQIPQTTYGVTKVIGELLINDYSRKRFIDGRAARLPTVFIRPGKPNAAASSFASGVFREPLNGETCLLPVDRSQAMPLLGYAQVVDCLIKLIEADPAMLGDDRSVNFPSTSFIVDDMITALETVAARRGIKLGPIVDSPDETIQTIVQGWPIATEFERATRMGMRPDPSLESVIERFITDFVPGQ
jgi:nucleoside-diphosphate-sugar epimerase